MINNQNMTGKKNCTDDQKKFTFADCKPLSGSQTQEIKSAQRKQDCNPDKGAAFLFKENTDDRNNDDVTCSNKDLAAMLGISDAYNEDGSGIHAEGSDVVAEFANEVDDAGNPTGKRVGFEDSAIISTKGTKITVKDVNNKEFVMDVPGNVAGTTFNDTTAAKQNGKSQAAGGTATDINQEVTDVGTMSIHVGANENQVIVLDIPKITTYTIGTDNINVMTSYTAQLSIGYVDEAINYVNSARSKLGAYENRFDHTTKNLEVSSENVTKALSAKIDTDMAEEMTEYTSQTVLTQAATSILSQANQRPSEVLQLLQN